VKNKLELDSIADNNEHKDSKRAGRPLSNVLDEAIIQSTLDVFSEVGYDALSIAEIARRAGATPPAIYRRYSGKLNLVLYALSREFGTLHFCVVENVSLKNDLFAFMNEVMKALTPKRIRIFAGILLASRDNHQLADLMAEKLNEAGNAAWEKMISNAHARGELNYTMVPKIVWELPMSFIITRLLFGRKRPDDGDIREFINSVMLPTLQNKVAGDEGDI